ncbi:MAG: carboxylating.nicotinate-nucleotide diphosphorylase, partial [Saccharolobus sp.]
MRKDSGILAGNKFILPFLRFFNFEVKYYINDGKGISKRDKILIFEGDASKLLSVERFILNFLARLSGIATITNIMVKKVK